MIKREQQLRRAIAEALNSIEATRLRVDDYERELALIVPVPDSFGQKNMINPIDVVLYEVDNDS